MINFSFYETVKHAVSNVSYSVWFHFSSGLVVKMISDHRCHETKNIYKKEKEEEEERENRKEEGYIYIYIMHLNISRVVIC